MAMWDKRRVLAGPGKRTAWAVLAALGMATAAVSFVSCSGAKAPGPPTYYISPSGSDSASGTSPATAWRSLARAGKAVFRPGTRLLLEGGSRFTGQLRFGRGDGGNPAKPIFVGSYGKGRATIDSNTNSAIVIVDTAGIDISNLVLVGSHTATTGGGINLWNDLPGNKKLEHVSITHVDVSGFANGISMAGGHGASGFRNVWVTDSVLHGNLDNGLMTYGPAFDAAAPSYVISNIEISHVTAFDNYGDPADKRHNSGSGIVLGSVDQGSVDWSFAHNNGGKGGARHEGPYGIWTYNSTKIMIEHDVSYDNHTSKQVDGGGFDLDQNTSDSEVQYNFAYGNDGPGYNIYSAKNDNALTGNVVRFNISSGDARKWAFYGEISVTGHVRDTAIYQNTVVAAPRHGAPASLALRLGRPLHGVDVRNNIFATYQPGPVVAAQAALPASAARLQGNDYYCARGPWLIQWGPSAYSSLSAWRAGTGQEMLGGRATGFSAAPDFAGPVVGAGATRAAAFRLQPRSPLVGAGLDLHALFGTEPGKADYSGRPLVGRKLNIGAG